MLKKWKKRKKGSVIIEFVTVLPVLITLIFVLVESFIYAMVIADYKEAAEESARVVAMQLRGHTGKIAPGAGTPSLPSEFVTELDAQVREKVDNVLEDNFYTRDFDAQKATLITDANGGEATCDQLLTAETDEQVICVYMKSVVNDTSRGFEAVEVRIKGHHHPLTMFGEWITDRYIMVHAASQKEMSKPF